MANYHYKHGDWKAVCDVCGFEYYGSQLRRRWDGAMVCQKDWETRHPQEFIRGIKENIVPSFIRPEQADVFAIVGNVDSLALNTRALNTFSLG